MAEIVGLAASVAGLLTTAGAAVKLTNTIFRIANDVQGAREEIEDFGRDINSFAHIIQIAHSTLNKYKKDPRLHSAVLKDILNKNTFDVLVDDAKRVVKHIKRIKRSLRSMGSVIKLWTKIKWILRSRDVKALGTKIESVKSSISIVMQLLVLEAAIQSKSPDQQEIEILKRQLKMQVQVIEIFKAREAQEIEDSIDPSESLQPEAHSAVQNYLIELSQSFEPVQKAYYMTPERTRAPYAQSWVREGASRSSRRRGMASSPPVIHGSARNISVSSPNSRREAAVSLGNPVQQFAVQMSSNSEESSIKTSEDHDSESSGSQYTSRAFISSQPHTSPTPTVSQSTSLHTPLSVQRTLRSQPYGDMGAIKGCIRTPKGKKLMTVYPDPSLPHNVISRTYAERLGCEMVGYLHFYELTVRGKKHASNSMVKFYWGRTSDDLREHPLEIVCHVFDEGVQDLVLGQEFLQQITEDEQQRNAQR